MKEFILALSANLPLQERQSLGYAIRGISGHGSPSRLVNLDVYFPPKASMDVKMNIAKSFAALLAVTLAEAKDDPSLIGKTKDLLEGAPSNVALSRHPSSLSLSELSRLVDKHPQDVKKVMIRGKLMNMITPAHPIASLRQHNASKIRRPKRPSLHNRLKLLALSGDPAPLLIPEIDAQLLCESLGIPDYIHLEGAPKNLKKLKKVYKKVVAPMIESAVSSVPGGKMLLSSLDVAKSLPVVGKLTEKAKSGIESAIDNKVGDLAKGAISSIGEIANFNGAKLSGIISGAGPSQIAPILAKATPEVSQAVNKLKQGLPLNPSEASSLAKLGIDPSSLDTDSLNAVNSLVASHSAIASQDAATRLFESYQSLGSQIKALAGSASDVMTNLNKVKTINATLSSLVGAIDNAPLEGDPTTITDNSPDDDDAGWLDSELIPFLPNDVISRLTSHLEGNPTDGKGSNFLKEWGSNIGSTLEKGYDYVSEAFAGMTTEQKALALGAVMGPVLTKSISAAMRNAGLRGLQSKPDLLSPSDILKNESLQEFGVEPELIQSLADSAKKSKDLISSAPFFSTKKVPLPLDGDVLTPSQAVARISRGVLADNGKFYEGAYLIPGPVPYEALADPNSLSFQARRIRKATRKGQVHSAIRNSRQRAIPSVQMANNVRRSHCCPQSLEGSPAGYLFTRMGKMIKTLARPLLTFVRSKGPQVVSKAARGFKNFRGSKAGRTFKYAGKALNIATVASISKDVLKSLGGFMVSGNTATVMLKLTFLYTAATYAVKNVFGNSSDAINNNAEARYILDSDYDEFKRLVHILYRYGGGANPVKGVNPPLSEDELGFVTLCLIRLEENMSESAFNSAFGPLSSELEKLLSSPEVVTNEEVAKLATELASEMPSESTSEPNHSGLINQPITTQGPNTSSQLPTPVVTPSTSAAAATALSAMGLSNTEANPTTVQTGVGAPNDGSFFSDVSDQIGKFFTTIKPYLPLLAGLLGAGTLALIIARLVKKVKGRPSMVIPIAFTGDPISDASGIDAIISLVGDATDDIDDDVLRDASAIEESLLLAGFPL